ncbi:MAG: hypothetical protein HXY35_04745 [Chloroflexi bacterium]|nr:hypothetical protein [Chloroflexota bacterium]
MKRNRRILGMTPAQVGILVGLAGTVCVLFGVTGWLIFGGAVNIQLPFSPFAEAAPTPVVTATTYVLPTFTPTVTPTPIPYEQLIPNGWKQFKTELVELWLPSSFKTTDKDANEELAIQGENSTSLYRMRVSVSYEPLTGDSLDAHLDAGLAKMDAQVRVVERRKVLLNSTEAIRMLAEVRVETVDVNQLIYAVQDGGTVWFVVYVAQINEFYEMLPLFEQSAKTFRVVK